MVDNDNWLNRAVDKILLTHRNTKLFLIMMTGPFLVMLKVIQYIIKFAVVMWLYKKGT